MFFINALKFWFYKIILGQDLNWILVFKVWEKRYKNNYPLIIDKIAYGITSKGERIALVPKDLANLLKAAQENPTKENYFCLKKWIIKNPPTSWFKKTVDNQHDQLNLNNKSKSVLFQKPKNYATLEEFTSALKQALGNLGTTVSQKTELQEPTNKYLVKFLKFPNKKNEEK